MGQSTLSKREKMVRNLRKYDAMPFHAIASVMNMDEENVKRVCQRAVREEKRALDREHFRRDRGVDPCEDSAVHGDDGCVSHEERCSCCMTAPRDGFGLRVWSGARVCYPCHEKLESGEIEMKPLDVEYTDADARPPPVSLSVTMQEIVDDVTDGLTRVYQQRNMATAQASRCMWTPLLEALGMMRGEVEGLIAQIERVKAEYGEPER